MVEWKKLGEVCEILDFQRKPVSKSDRRDGVYPYYGANGIQDYIEDYIFDGTFLLFGEDGSVINEDKSPVLHWATGKIWVNNHAHILKESNSSSLRFLYYALQCVDVSDIVRGTPPKINQANMRNIMVPIPSLSEQQRIVGILDTFTASINNLKAQITQRRKQYEYYRDQLLDLEGKPGVEMKTLGEVCEILDSQRKPVSKSDRRDGVYPYYGANGIQDYIEDYIFDGTFLLFGEDGSVINEDKSPVLHWATGKIWVNNHAHILKESNSSSLRFLYYALQCVDVSDIVRGTPPKINQANMRNIMVPIPSLSVQHHIVSILDTFEASLQNLEAQLKQREKQYEYYRNKLLTFE